MSIQPVKRPCIFPSKVAAAYHRLDEILKKVNGNSELSCTYPRDNHAIHADLNRLIQWAMYENGPDEDQQKSWDIFLQQLERLKLIYPNYKEPEHRIQRTLDLSLERRRLYQQSLPFVARVEEVFPNSPHFTTDVEAIEQMATDCFGYSSRSQEEIIRGQGRRCFVARNQQNKVIGYLICLARPVQEGSNQIELYLSYLGRDPGTCGLELGRTLLKHLFQQDLSMYCRLSLNVGQQNTAAIRLYKSFGFTEDPAWTIRNYPDTGEPGLRFIRAIPE